MIFFSSGAAPITAGTAGSLAAFAATTGRTMGVTVAGAYIDMVASTVRVGASVRRCESVRHSRFRPGSQPRAQSRVHFRRPAHKYA
jgi:hypothetical protein